MIDFRYHLVSIVAVFLALAIGIVVGSQAISPKFQKTLHDAALSAQKANNHLYAQNAQLSQQISTDNAFAQAASKPLLHDLLLGQHVVLVVAPGADSQTVTGVTSALQQAGAAVTGQVQLQSQFFDTSAVTEQALKSAVKRLTPAGITLPGSAADPRISGQEAAAQVIATAIASKDGLLPTMTPAQSQRILNGFGQQNFLQVSGPNGSTTLAGQATMAVVVIPGTVPPARSASSFNLTLISLAHHLQVASKGALLAGSIAGSGQGSAIDALVNGGAGVTLSTVDNADTAPGQVIVAQALRELLNPHPAPTSYGVIPNAVPSPAPSPVPSPSPSQSPSTTRKATG